MKDMNLKEAVSLAEGMRNQYRALARLEEVLRVAAVAENLKGEMDVQIVALQTQRSNLQDELLDLQKRERELSDSLESTKKMAAETLADFAAKKGEAERSLHDLINGLQDEYESKRSVFDARMSADRQAAESQHEARMSAMADEEATALARVDALKASLSELKAKIAGV